MKKKALSLALALAMCLGLTVPVSAAETKEVRADVSLTGIVGNEEIPASPIPMQLYRVEFPATLVISGCGKLDGPARRVSITASIYEAVQNGPEEPDDWSFEESGPYIPNAWVYGDEIVDLNWTENSVYTFDPSFAGKTVFLDLNEEWESVDAGAGNGVPSTGTTTILLRFPSTAGPEDPTEPETPVEPVVKTAVPTNDKLYIDGELVVPTAYKIGGSNYFKIRDMAALLNGTDAQFSVGYDDAAQTVTLTTGEGYEKKSSDLAGVPAGEKEAVSSNNAIYINGEKAELTVYKIGGSNYFKLRDLGKALGFHVGYTEGYGAFIETGKTYEG